MRAVRQTFESTERLAEAGRQAGRQAGKQTDRQADRQAYRQADRQADRQTDKQANIRRTTNRFDVSSVTLFHYSVSHATDELKVSYL